MWITVTEAHLQQAISGPELDAFRAAALASGQTDPVTGIVAEITQEIRGYVAACTRNQLGPSGTIPDELLHAFLSLFVPRFQSRAGGVVIDPNGQREREVSAARQLLGQVASCKFAIVQPVAPDTSSTVGGSVQVICPGERTASRQKMSGI